MVFSDFTKQRILSLAWKGYTISGIVECLVLEEEIRVSKQGVRQFLKRFALYKTIARKPGSGLPPKLSPNVQLLIEEAMRQDDETTATQLQAKLASQYIYVSLATIVRSRLELGWTYRGSAYCQLIRNANKQKRYDWAKANLHDDFENVIWSDETTVQLETHKRYCYRKDGEKPLPKPRPKHPIKIHVWAGISKRGATKLCLFDGIMAAPLYCDILQKTLIPFLQETFPAPTTHRFMQDNDPKHTSHAAQDFYASSGINWWRTPAESPDLNPIENLWHEMKEYIRREVKPQTKQELVHGLIEFWESVDKHKCWRYINHLKKVIPRVIELHGEPTGY